MAFLSKSALSGVLHCGESPKASFLCAISWSVQFAHFCGECFGIVLVRVFSLASASLLMRVSPSVDDVADDASFSFWARLSPSCVLDRLDCFGGCFFPLPLCFERALFD